MQLTRCGRSNGEAAIGALLYGPSTPLMFVFEEKIGDFNARNDMLGFGCYTILIILDLKNCLFFNLPSSRISSCVISIFDTVMCLHTWRSPALDSGHTHQTTFTLCLRLALPTYGLFLALCGKDEQGWLRCLSLT